MGKLLVYIYLTEAMWEMSSSTYITHVNWTKRHLRYTFPPLSCVFVPQSPFMLIFSPADKLVFFVDIRSPFGSFEYLTNI